MTDLPKHIYYDGHDVRYSAKAGYEKYVELANVDDLKKAVCRTFAVDKGVNQETRLRRITIEDCIDHLAQQGYLNLSNSTPLRSENAAPLPRIEGLEEAVIDGKCFQGIKHSVGVLYKAAQAYLARMEGE